jgi:hypothetical protein
MDWIRDRALTLALMAMFLLFLVGQAAKLRLKPPRKTWAPLTVS